jgi:hypothetical protein
MKRFLALVLLTIAAAWTTPTAAAAAGRVVHHGGAHNRTLTVVHRGWPLRRPLRVVMVHPVRTPVLVTPRFFLAPVVWSPVVVPRPAARAFVWEDGETLTQDDEWTEFTLNCDTQGSQLYLEVVRGKIQGDWAEVVFDNGDTSVVDFAEKTRGRASARSRLCDGRKVNT